MTQRGEELLSWQALPHVPVTDMFILHVKLP